MPTETAAQRHDRMIRDEMEQAERIRTLGKQSDDHWQKIAPTFRPPSDDQDDGAVTYLASLIGRDDRAIDVGAGGGRMAVPLAKQCREVVAVEPSPSMRAVLEEAIRQRGIGNIRIVAASWEEAEVDPAELAFASHVSYSVRDIDLFLRKLTARATKSAALVIMTDPPQSPFAPLWKAVYGEDRLRLPCRDEVLDVLREQGLTPEVIPLRPIPVTPFGTPAEALDTFRSRLFAAPGTPADARLQAAIHDLTEVRDGQVWVKDARPRDRQILVWGGTGKWVSAR